MSNETRGTTARVRPDDRVRPSGMRHAVQSAAMTAELAMTEAIDAAAVLRGLGAEVDEVVLPPFDHFHAAGWTVIHGEWFNVHARHARQRAHDYAQPPGRGQSWARS